MRGMEHQHCADEVILSLMKVNYITITAPSQLATHLYLQCFRG